MISIRSVRGQVGVFDQTSSYLEPAAPGMVLQKGKNYLIASDGKSEATIVKDGTATRVAPGEWYVVNRKGVVRKGKHRERGTARLFFGRLWAKIAKDHPELEFSGNVAVGIRG